jgi:hypothetical protein
MKAKSDYWFRAKRNGRGWGLPCAWQGWVFFIVWFALLLWAAFRLMPHRPFAFTLVLALMTVVLVLVCYAQGEPLGDGDDTIL